MTTSTTTESGFLVRQWALTLGCGNVVTAHIAVMSNSYYSNVELWCSYFSITTDETKMYTFENLIEPIVDDTFCEASFEVSSIFM